jgi:hypothetical protein
MRKSRERDVDMPGSSSGWLSTHVFRAGQAWSRIIQQVGGVAQAK